ncbi:carbonic anhydrase 2-like [Schistocerca serialis cubense]|uniref:carbonic anhydrase 2-like n=1 Tax=Schistocerca serialis cubense TaxID=2023355 RepID=UPI00214EC7EC|nr:carbonic anhydrase 2-like [Schistocerca serialis cubense]
MPSAATACIPALLVLLYVTRGNAEARPEGFAYEGRLGPSHWSEEFQSCAGKYQSPIDIEEHLVTQVRLPALRFRGFRTPPATATATNNGHTVLVQFNTSEPAVLSGGPLRGDYEFAQLHFHWGVNDSVGSEDTINNHSFPLELHMVFYKTDYGSFNGALSHKDGLAVVALFYEVFGDDNPVYAELAEAIPQVEAPGSKVPLRRALFLGDLLPDNRELYFTYNGSLTTPPCSEVVTWIEFKTPTLLSHRQVDVFRKMKSEDGLLTHNFRPVQPLGDRAVLFNVGNLPPAVAPRAPTTSFQTLLTALFTLLWRHH